MAFDNSKPNLIERLDNLLAALDEAQDHVTTSRILNGDDDNSLSNAAQRIEDAGGIAGEILTMIDGR